MIASELQLATLNQFLNAERAVLRTHDYSLDELKFAFAYHVYLRWQTHRNHPSAALARLDGATLQSLVAHQQIKTLQCEATSHDLRLLASLRPTDSTSAAEGKLKGQAAKWLREQSGERFARGYFACTSGKSTAEQVAGYLAGQAEHHGYAARVLPPVYVESFALSQHEEQRLQSPHSESNLRFHVVLATWRRRGVFGSRAGAAIAEAWRALAADRKFALLKVSFVPDHVHLALRVHPRVVPAEIVLALMNEAQRVVWRDFSSDAIQARVERLWQASAYLGSFGELATPQIEAYLRRLGDEESKNTGTKRHRR